TKGIAASGISSSMSSQPRSANAASSLAPVAAVIVVRRDSASMRSASGSTALLLPEVEQPAGDYVALNLGGAAIDRRGAGVQVLRAPWCVVELQRPGEQVADRVVEPLFGG